MSVTRGCLIYTICNVQWKIEKYSWIRIKKGDAILSPEFETSISCGKWWIEFFPEGDSKSQDGYISIFLYNKTIQGCSTNFEVSILNKKKEKKFAQNLVNQDFTEGWGLKNFIKKCTLFDIDLQLLVEDTLTINLQLQVEGKVASPVIESDSHTLSTDFLNLLSTSQMSDLEIRVKERTFKTHKQILAARSSVFAAMFNHDLEENKTNVVNIEDTEPEVMEVLLHYMYTDKCDHLEDMCSLILPVADKYCLEHLKQLCESQLTSQLNSENVIQSLELADTYRLIVLKKNCINKICDVGGKILESSEWKRLVTDNKALALEAMAAAFLKLS